MNGEGDRVAGEVGDLPRPERPVVSAAMQRIGPVVELRVEGLAANLVLAAADAVHVTAWNGIVDRVRWVLS